MEKGEMKILTDVQESVLNALYKIEDVRRNFYLTGGTALSAYYLQHRYSDDLDLFTHSVSIESIGPLVQDALALEGLNIGSERRSPSFHRYKVNDSLQLDLVRDVDFRVGSPQLIEGVMVDSKKNIAVNKVCAIYGRLDPKDYIDLFFLLKDGEFEIADLLRLTQKKDAGLEPFQWAKAIADSETISVLPRMIIECDLKELKNFFRKLREDVVDSIAKP
jgi:predicted nucleotidyltransferase component of viral defense system